MEQQPSVSSLPAFGSTGPLPPPPKPKKVSILLLIFNTLSDLSHDVSLKGLDLIASRPSCKERLTP